LLFLQKFRRVDGNKEEEEKLRPEQYSYVCSIQKLEHDELNREFCLIFLYHHHHHLVDIILFSLLTSAEIRVVFPVLDNNVFVSYRCTLRQWFF